MSVYVDSMLPCLPNPKWKWDRACHMFADTDDELHAFAISLGLKRSWFQSAPPASCPHYDLTTGMRERAVKMGAVELDRRGTVQKWKEIRERGVLFGAKP